jgi:NTP pyrophosphatase (non-canonical NTP hydrolase)
MEEPQKVCYACAGRGVNYGRTCDVCNGEGVVPLHVFGPIDVDSYESPFVVQFRALQNVIHENALNKGFWSNNDNKGEKICLMHAELSEALEAIRDGDPPDKHLPQYPSSAVELADAVIRIMDYCKRYNLPLVEAILDKIDYNRSRPYKHGKEF